MSQYFLMLNFIIINLLLIFIFNTFILNISIFIFNVENIIWKLFICYSVAYILCNNRPRRMKRVENARRRVREFIECVHYDVKKGSR